MEKMKEDNVSGPSELRESLQLEDGDSDDGDGSITGDHFRCPYTYTRCTSGHVLERRTCDQEVTVSLVTVHQRQLSVPSLLGWLVSTSESWAVNVHTT